MDKTVVITLKVVGTILASALALLIVYRLAPVFAILFISLFIVLAMEPVVKFFSKQTFLNKPIHRNAAVIISYAALLVAIGLIFTVGLPPVLGQVRKLIQNFGDVLANLSVLEEAGISVEHLNPQITKITDGLLDKTVSVFSSFFAFLTVLVLSIYLSMDWERLKGQALSLLGNRLKPIFEETILEIEIDLAKWVRGQLILMLFVGVLSFLAVLVLGVDYPLAIGLISGLLEIVPFLGPLISAILAGLVGFSISPAKGFAAIGLFILIQQIENSLLVPKIMSEVSGFSPIIVLLAVLIAGNFFGAIGAITAVPITMILVLIGKKFLKYNNRL